MNKHKQNSEKGCLIALRSWMPNKRAQSTIEFAALMMFILAALLVFQKYIARGIAGRWKGVGDAMGHGRIYDPNYTTECEYHGTLNVWFDRACFEACRDNPPCNGGPPVDQPGTPDRCNSCAGGCTSDMCSSGDP